MLVAATAAAQSETPTAELADPFPSQVGGELIYPYPAELLAEGAAGFFDGDIGALIQLQGADPSEARVSVATDIDLTPYLDMPPDAWTDVEIEAYEDWQNSALIILAVQAPRLDADALLSDMIAANVMGGPMGAETTIAGKRILYAEAGPDDGEEWSWALAYGTGDALYAVQATSLEPTMLQVLADLP